MFDDFSYLPAVIAGVVTLAAWSARPAPATATTAAAAATRSRPPVLVVGLVVVSIVVALPLLAAERSRLAADAGRANAVAGRWSTAASDFATAVSLHPDDVLARLGLGLAAAEAGEDDVARDAYRAAGRLSPGDPRVPGALAALTDDPAVEAEMLDAASRRSTDPQYAVRLAVVLARAGQLQAAAEAYALAVMLRPDLYAELNGYPVTREATREALPTVAERVSALEADRLDRVLWDVGLADGSPPTDAPSAWHAIASAVRGDLSAATAQVDEARRTAPHDPHTALAQAAIARIGCHREEYERAMELVALLGGGARTSEPALSIGRDPIYSGLGLGDYQPSWVDRPPPPPVWPFGLVPAPTCEWAP
jgi:Flp pilus assembly protein TadD